MTKYKDLHEATKDVAIRKAKVHGVSDWPFTYRNQQVIVTARKEGDKVRTSTTHVRNKGK